MFENEHRPLYERPMSASVVRPRDKVAPVRELAFAVEPSHREYTLFDAHPVQPEGKTNTLLERFRTGIKYKSGDIPPLPTNGFLNGLLRGFGYGAEFIRDTAKALRHSGMALPLILSIGVVSVALAMAFFGTGAWPLLVGALGIGVASAIAIYRGFRGMERFGFGPHKPTPETRARFGTHLNEPGFYAKKDEKQNPGYYYLAEKPAKKRELKKAIKRIAEIKTVKEMKKITGNPGYEIEKWTGGHCTVENGKIYVVLNKVNVRFYRGEKIPESNNTKFDISLRWFRMRWEKSGRSRYSFAHELGHAIEFYSRGSTGQLEQFDETKPELMNTMVRAVLRGLPDSWFHDNTPMPIEPPKPVKPLRLPNLDFYGFRAWRHFEKHSKIQEEYERKIFRQKHWNYEELFAEMVALYLLRPEWLTRNYPKEAELIRKLIHESPMAKHLMVQ